MSEEPEQQNEELAKVGSAEFFIQELARMEHEEVQRYKHLSKRLVALEQKGKSMTDDPEKMLGSFFIVLFVIQVLPIVIDIIQAWHRPSESLPL